MIKAKAAYLHILAWMLFILLPLLFILADNVLKGAAWTCFLKGHLIRSAFVILLFYFNYHWLVPRYLLNKKPLFFVLANAAALILVWSAMRFLREDAEMPPAGVEEGPQGATWLVHPFILTLSIGIGMAVAITLYRKLKVSEQKKAEAELAYMKSRLNPHFLFNTLNSVYALAITKSDDTADAVSRLSSIMRYLITDTGSGKVSLEKEINYISDFIELQRLRLTEKTTVDFRCDGITAGKYIVPLLLISFVENAFKYGVSTEIVSDIKIHILIKGDELQLKVSNVIAVKKSTEVEREGLGLTAVRQLLDHFYKDRYHLLLNSDSEKFKVHLALQLT